MQQVLVDSTWKEEIEAAVRGRAGEIANRTLLFFVERLTGNGTIRLECALAARELMLEFIDAAPRAIDDGAAAKVWAATLAATILSVQWSGVPVVDLRQDVGIDRGLDEESLVDDDETSDLALDFSHPLTPQWSELACECATETAGAMGTLVTDVLDRGAMVRSTLAITERDRRWLVPSYRSLRGHGAVRARIPIGGAG